MLLELCWIIVVVALLYLLALKMRFVSGGYPVPEIVLAFGLLPFLFVLGCVQKTTPGPPDPLPLSQFGLATYPAGIFTTKHELRNDTKAILLEVKLVVSLQREDGKVVTIDRFWSRWDINETKSFDVPSANYEKLSIQGTARCWGKSMRIESAWFIKK